MEGTRLLPLALTFAVAMVAQKQSPPGTATNDGPCDAISRFAISRLIPSRGLTDLNERKNLKNPKDLSAGVSFSCILPEQADLRFLVATVPNPIDTHLGLWFDRAVEAILNAAGSVGFRFQEAWIPWSPDLVREEPDIFKREELEAERQRREKEPGVLLFHALKPCPEEKPSECQKSDLVVLLVPETPTGGIQPEVFADAVKMISRASSSQKPSDGASNATTPQIPVMGPSFSGSFASLGKIVELNKTKNNLMVISGTAESADAWKEAFKANSKSTYSTTVHDIVTQYGALSKHMSVEWKKEGQRFALLTESQTGIGWITTLELDRANLIKNNVDDTPLIFRYPFEISRLRNAYGDESLKTVVGAQPPTASFRNLLRLPLFDVGSGTDSTPTFAINQTPLSQDAVLRELAQSLDHQGITLAGILATDVFDALFLARYLRDACPDVRLFTFDSDLLYERAAEDFPLDGTLALATYPSFAPNQVWTHQSDGFLFPSRGSEGIYNATRALLINAQFVSDDYKEKPLAEYFNPTQPTKACATPANYVGCYAPPLWLTVMGRNGYWPLAVEDATVKSMKTVPGPEKESPLVSGDGSLLAWPSAGNVSHFGLDHLPLLWRMIFIFLSLALGLHLALTFIAACAIGDRRARWFPHMNVWADEEGWPARLCYLFVSSFSLLALYALFVAPLVSISWAAPAPAPGAHGYVQIAELFLLLFAALCGSPLLALFRKRAVPGGDGENLSKPGETATVPAAPKWPETWHFAILGLVALLAVYFAWSLWALFGPPARTLKHGEAFFFAYRSLHLTSGVSPVVPLLFLLPAYLLWARVHLKRVEMVYGRLVDTPALTDVSKFDGGELPALAGCRNEIDSLVKLPLPVRLRTLGALVVAMAIALYMMSPLRSFEYDPFDLLFLVMLSILYALIFLTWTRFLLVWRKFSVFLEELERLSLRFAFDELPRRSAISPLFQFVGRRSELAMLVGIRERLAELKLRRPTSVDSASLMDASDKLVGEIDKILTSATKGERISRKGAAPLRKFLGQVNDALLEELHRGNSKWPISAHRPKEEGKKDPDQGEPELAGQEPKLSVSPDMLREQVIAVQYYDYIEYILHQQRNLLLFAVVGFVLSIVALHAYPFQGPGTITTFITITFVALAGGVIVVLAQADRDPILRRITKTTSRELSGGFFLKVAGYLGVPLVTVLGSQFPSLGHFLFSWIQPVLDAVR
jgi:hypothetical protein